MWFVTNNIDSQSIEWELIMFKNIRVLRLCSTDWKSSLNSDVIYQTKMNIRLIDLKQTRLNLIQGFQDYASFFTSKICTIFLRIVHPKSRIMRKLCKLCNIFSEKLNAFCNEAVAICSAPSCDCFGRHGE